MFKYIVKPEEKIVIAIMRGDEENPLRFDALNFIENKTHGFIGLPYDRVEEFCIKDQYTGIARCHDLDEFDEKLGKELAMRRALAKHHRDFQKVINRYLNEVSKVENIMRRRLEKKVVNNEKDILDLLEKTSRD